MESPMAGLNHTLETSDISMFNLPIPWQFLIVGAIFIWLIIPKFTAVTNHIRAFVQSFVLRHVESGVPVILAIQVLSARWFPVWNSCARANFC